MNHYFRLILIALIVLPWVSLARDYPTEENTTHRFVPDSLAQRQLIIIDSISFFDIYKANTLLSYSLIDQIVDDSLKYEYRMRKIRFLKLLSNNQEAIEFIEDILQNENVDTRFYVELAQNYVAVSKYLLAIKRVQEGILISEKNGDDNGVIIKRNLLIEIFCKIEMFDEADKYFNQNVELCNKVNNRDGLIFSYLRHGEGLTFYKPDLALEYLQYAIDLTKTLPNTRKFHITEKLIRFYINTNQFYKAKLLIWKYMDDFSSVNFIDDSNVLTYLAHIYSLEDNLDSTIYYNKQALQLRIKAKNSKMTASSCLNLSGNYLAKNEINLANEYLEQAKEAVNSSNDKYMMAHYLRGKIKYYNFINDYQQAFQASQKLVLLTEEISSSQYQEDLAKVNTNFNIQQKYILLEQELNRRKSATRQLIYVLTSILMALSILYVIYLLRKKNYSYLKLVTKASTIEKKLSIVNKEIHRFQAVFEHSIIGILIIDNHGRIQYANRQGKKMLNIDDKEEEQVNSFFKLFSSNNKKKVKSALSNVHSNKQKDKNIKIRIDTIENLVWLNISFAPLDFGSNEEAVLITLNDITQEEIKIDNEQKQKRELQTLLNSVTESISFIDRKGRIRALNDKATKELSVESGKIIGANYFEIIDQPIRENRIRMFEKVILSKKPLIEIENIGDNNNMVSMYPNLNSGNEVDYVSEFVQDISEKKLAEEQIDSLKERVLRSQMNPHFIFNSLTSIQSYIITNETPMASKYLNSFARLIRLILESSRFEYITLTNEIDILTYYLEIQRMRFAENLKISFTVDPTLDIEKIKIPPMLAQPFIENSIEHGIQHVDKQGELDIKFIKDGTRLLIEIIDNGIGRAASLKMQQNNLFHSKSLSTKITNERILSLNKHAKQHISYNIIDLKDNRNNAIGTQVIINVPIT